MRTNRFFERYFELKKEESVESEYVTLFFQDLFNLFRKLFKAKRFCEKIKILIHNIIIQGIFSIVRRRMIWDLFSLFYKEGLI